MFRKSAGSVVSRWTDRLLDDSAGGDSGGDDGSGNSAEVAIAKAVEAATAGLKKKVDQLLGEKKSAQDQLRGVQDILDQFGGKDGLSQLDELRQQLDRDETLKRIKEGKWEEVLAERTAAMTKAHQAELAKGESLRKELEEKLAAEGARRRRQSLETQLRQAAAEVKGFIPEATSDALLRALNEFDGYDDETDRPFKKDADGHPVLGKDGKTALGLKEWLEGQQETSRHWFGESLSGGASGSSAGAKGGSTNWETGTQRDFERKFKEQFGGK